MEICAKQITSAYGLTVFNLGAIRTGLRRLKGSRIECLIAG